MEDFEFSARVRLMTDRLWRISWSILRSGADADDALQEALLRAWKSVGRLKDETLFETWLTRILINECKRILRKRRPEATADGMPETVRPDNRELYEAIGTLKKDLKLPLILYYMEGYPIRDIARILRLSENNVKARLFRARKILKQELNEEAAEDE